MSNEEIQGIDSAEFWGDDIHHVLDVLEKQEKESGLKWYENTDWLKTFPVDSGLSLNINLVILSKTNTLPFNQVLIFLDGLIAKAKDNSLAPEIIDALSGVRILYVKLQEDYQNRPKS